MAPWERPDALRPASVRWAAHMKRWTRVVAAGTGLMVAVGSAVGAAKGYAVKLWRVVTRDRPTPADVLKTGTPTVATDFVPEPKPEPQQSAGELPSLRK